MIKYVFGPVASRRLGISLGVDIIPFKTCSLDCIYCECGKTTDKTLERKRYVDPAIVLEEIKTAVEKAPYIEYITFSGSGEPTVSSDIGLLISEIKKITDIPVAVLTNGTMLHRQDVRNEIAKADLVLPSLDAATQDTFQKINRPLAGLTIDSVIDGMTQFRKIFPGQLWLEVFIAKGINDTPDELELIHKAASQIKPDRLQLNTLDRPPAYDDVYSVSSETLQHIKKMWHDLPVEIIKRIHRREEITSFSFNLESNILNTIKRRPLTIDDLEALTGKKREELFRYIDILEREKKIFPKIVDDKIFYAPTVPPKRMTGTF
jgi:wyosine [tRNA(Phe)-imidazoG37] synthetase (radical SAM superfamily)